MNSNKVRVTYYRGRYYFSSERSNYILPSDDMNNMASETTKYGRYE